MLYGPTLERTRVEERSDESVEDCWSSMRSRLERHDEYGGQQARFGMHVISCDGRHVMSYDHIYSSMPRSHGSALWVGPHSGNYAVPLPYAALSNSYPTPGLPSNQHASKCTFLTASQEAKLCIVQPEGSIRVDLLHVFMWRVSLIYSVKSNWRGRLQ